MRMVYNRKTNQARRTSAGASFWRGALLWVMALTWTACASALQTSVSSEPKALPLPEAVVALVNARDADPQNPAKTEAVIKAALEARRFTLAFDEAQRLRELQPDSDIPLELLGEACFGLRLFNQAADSYYAANQKVFSASRAYRIGWILLSKGSKQKAQEYLSEAVSMAPDEWRLVELLVSAHTSPAGKQGELEDFLARHPAHPEATAALAKLQAGERPTLDKIVQGEGQVIRVPINDAYEIPIKFNNLSIKTTLMMGDGLVLSAPAQVRLALIRAKEKREVMDSHGNRGSARTVIVKSVKIGDLVLENVPAIVLDEQYTSKVTASIGIGRLAGYSLLIDRKAERLEFHPHTLPTPKLSEHSTKLQCYKSGSSWMVEVGMTNLDTKHGVQGLGSLQFGYQNTVFHTPNILEQRLGTLDTTQTVTMRGSLGYGKRVMVERMTLGFAGDTFVGFAADARRGNNKQGYFYATDLGQLQAFTPHLLIGRDVLYFYRFLLDTQSHMLHLERYE
ncbi:MAG: hypothetical protein ACKO6N_22420 [Myxococcota bacterium]